MWNSFGISLNTIIENRMGIITDNRELVVANPVPAKFIALANAMKESTNINPSPTPKIIVWKENSFAPSDKSSIKLIDDAVR